MNRLAIGLRLLALLVPFVVGCQQESEAEIEAFDRGEVLGREIRDGIYKYFGNKGRWPRDLSELRKAGYGSFEGIGAVERLDMNEKLATYRITIGDETYSTVLRASEAEGRSGNAGVKPTL